MYASQWLKQMQRATPRRIGLSRTLHAAENDAAWAKIDLGKISPKMACSKFLAMLYGNTISKQWAISSECVGCSARDHCLSAPGYVRMCTDQVCTLMHASAT